MEKHEIAVIGAGPAGSTAAYFLAQKNFDIILVDKEIFPRDKPCGGGLTVKTVDFLKKFGLYDKGYIEKKIDVIKLTHVRGLEATLEVQNAIETVRRKFFDQFLALKAVDTGALFLENEPLIELKRKNGFFELKTKSKVFKADFVIGADGVEGKTAAMTGLEHRSSKNELMLAAVAEIPYKHNLDFIELSLGYLRNGYGWVFPKKEYINIGIGCRLSSCKEFRASVKRFLKYIKKKFKVKADKMLKYSCIPVVGSSRRILEGKRVLLVGDAAGLGDPWSGEGIYQALLSGWIGALTASAILNGKKLSYMEIIDKFILRNLKVGNLFSKIYYSFQYYDVKFTKEYKSLIEKYLKLLLKNEIGYAYFLKVGIPFLLKLLVRQGTFLLKRI